MRIKFKINGLDCANCAGELERAIKKIDGIENVCINFIMQRMELEYNENDKDEIVKRIRKIIKKEEPDVTIEEI